MLVLVAARDEKARTKAEFAFLELARARVLFAAADTTRGNFIVNQLATAPSITQLNCHDSLGWAKASIPKQIRNPELWKSRGTGTGQLDYPGSLPSCEHESAIVGRSRHRRGIHSVILSNGVCCRQCGWEASRLTAIT